MIPYTSPSLQFVILSETRVLSGCRLCARWGGEAKNLSSENRKCDFRRHAQSKRVFCRRSASANLS